MLWQLPLRARIFKCLSRTQLFTIYSKSRLGYLFSAKRTNAEMEEKLEEAQRRIPSTLCTFLINTFLISISTFSSFSSKNTWSLTSSWNLRQKYFQYSFIEVKQKLVIKYYKNKFLGNEGPIEMFYNNSGFLNDYLAPEFNALVVYMEHRYFFVK
jgi:hypothetical protein